MRSFKQHITEQKNTHMTHIEDLLIGASVSLENVNIIVAENDEDPLLYL